MISRVVLDGVGVAVAFGSVVGVGVAVPTSVGVGVAVALGSGVAVAVAVADGVGVAVPLGSGVAVAVGVGVVTPPSGVAVAVATAPEPVSVVEPGQRLADGRIMPDVVEPTGGMIRHWPTKSASTLSSPLAAAMASTETPNVMAMFEAKSPAATMY